MPQNPLPSSKYVPRQKPESWQTHLGSGRSVLLPDPDGIDVVWQRLGTVANCQTRDWTDAYLASFAIQADCRMVSFDAGFAQYQKVGQSQELGLDFLHLQPEFDVNR